MEPSRLIYEPLEERHAALLFSGFQETEMYRFLPEDPPKSIETLGENYRSRSRGSSPDGKETWLNWAVRLRVKNKYVGRLEATIHPDHSAEIAYLIFPGYQRQGFATEGCKHLIKILWKDFSVRRIRAEMDTRNSPSFRLAESLGFKRIAEKKKADYFKGADSDEYLYELVLSTNP